MSRYTNQDDPPPPYSQSQYNQNYSPVSDEEYLPPSRHTARSQSVNAGKYEHDRVFMLHRLHILRQQYTNSRDHVSSLREEVLKQRYRTEQTLNGTYQYLKDELKKLYKESMEYIRSTEQQLLDPLDEHIIHLNRNASVIDSVVENLNTDERTLVVVLPEADRICSEMKPPRVGIPKFELLTEESNIPLCNVGLSRKGRIPSKLDESTKKHDKKRSEKRAVTPPQAERLPQKSKESDRLAKEILNSSSDDSSSSSISKLLCESTSGSESDDSSLATEKEQTQMKKKTRNKVKMREQFSDSFKELQQLYDSAKKNPWSRKL